MNLLYKHIYHFANFKEGYHILKTYREYKLDLPVTVVISTYNQRQKSKYHLKNIITIWSKIRFKKKFNALKSIDKLRIEFVDDVNSKEFIASINTNSLAICTGFTQIFSKNLINSFNNAYNFHQSLLPYYKGPVPTFWQIKNEEEWSGFSIHELSSTIDAGPIVHQQEIKINTSSPSELQTIISKHIAGSFQNILSYIVTGDNSWKLDIDAKKYYKQLPDYLGFPNND